MQILHDYSSLRCRVALCNETSSSFLRVGPCRHSIVVKTLESRCYERPAGYCSSTASCDNRRRVRYTFAWVVRKKYKTHGNRIYIIRILSQMFPFYFIISLLLENHIAIAVAVAASVGVEEGNWTGPQHPLHPLHIPLTSKMLLSWSWRIAVVEWNSLYRRREDIPEEFPTFVFHN